MYTFPVRSELAKPEKILKQGFYKIYIFWKTPTHPELFLAPTGALDSMMWQYRPSRFFWYFEHLCKLYVYSGDIVVRGLLSLRPRGSRLLWARIKAEICDALHVTQGFPQPFACLIVLSIYANINYFFLFDCCALWVLSISMGWGRQDLLFAARGRAGRGSLSFRSVGRASLVRAHPGPLDVLDTIF